MTTRRDWKWRTVLLLDFDTFDAYRAFPERARFALITFTGYSRTNRRPIRRFKVRRFRSSNRKWHVAVLMYCRRLPPPLFIVALQSIFGSDWKRETFNLYRARGLNRAPRSWRKMGVWNTLYREKL